MMLLAYLLVFQALLVGSTHGAMAANAADPLSVICINDGVTTAPNDPDESRKTAQDCPCATLCQTAAAGGAVAGAEPVVAYLAPFARAEPTPATKPLPRVVWRTIAAEPRGPPLPT